LLPLLLLKTQQFLELDATMPPDLATFQVAIIDLLDDIGA
jgi:hypothetical protein